MSLYLNKKAKIYKIDSKGQGIDEVLTDEEFLGLIAKGYDAIVDSDHDEKEYRILSAKNISIKKPITGSVDSSNVIESIKQILLRWADGSYDPKDIVELKNLDIPKEYTTVPSEIYRGEKYDRLTVKDLKRGECFTYGVSWTKDKKIAKQFAEQNDSAYGVVWKYHPKPQDILLDVDFFARDNGIKLPYDEKEVILKDNTLVTKENIESLNKIPITSNLVSSGLSPILYHFTLMDKAVSILEENKFKLKTMVGTAHEETISKDYYYLSTTRHKLGGYHLDRDQGAILVLDGKKLATKYSGDPIDFWGEEFRKVSPTKFEAEDRIWSKDPTIENAARYVLEVHVAIKLGKDNYHLDYDLKSLRRLLNASQAHNIPVYVYDNEKDFKTLNKNHTIPLKDIPFKEDEVKTEEEGYPYTKTNYLEPWYELYVKDNKEDLSKEAKALLYKFQYHDYYESFYSDVHNAKSREDPYLHKIVKVMQKHKWKKLREYYDFVKKKWDRLV
jgi:hypothetical protein